MKNILLRTIVLVLVASGLALTSAHAQYTNQVLHNFGSFSTDAHSPEFPMVFDAAGNLYGTTTTNGGISRGAAYELSPSSSGTWTEAVIYTFPDGGPILPEGGLTFDGAGNLYGVSFAGGAGNEGTVYELSPSSSGWTATVLHSFAGGTDGLLPTGELVFDASGHLFGVTTEGGSTGCSSTGCGTVYELSPSGGGWTYRVLYAFTGGVDGAFPVALTMDAPGNLYGVALGGGDTGCRNGCGTIYRLQPSSGTYAFSRIYSFTPLGPAGFTPYSLTLDAARNIYGTTIGGGGKCGCGAVFKLTRPASAGWWKPSVLHAFTGMYDGGLPVAVTLDSSGNVFGTTGLGSLTSYGAVFKISPVSGGWNFATIHNFVTDGGHPDSGVILDWQGDLFGNTDNQGQFGYGEVFELSPR